MCILLLQQLLLGCPGGGETQSVSAQRCQGTECAEKDNSPVTNIENKSKEMAPIYSKPQVSKEGQSNNSASNESTGVSPEKPQLLLPSSAMVTSKDSLLKIQGNCSQGTSVSVEGDLSTEDIIDPKQSLSQVCLTKDFTFVIQKIVDGKYILKISAIDPQTKLKSAPNIITWVRDTTPPQAVSVTVPHSSPFVTSEADLTISGACETGAVVSWTGTTSGSVSCTAGSYRIDATQSNPGVFDMVLTQTDPAGNKSQGTPFRWIRDITIPPLPTVAVPSSSILATNGANFEISGSCLSGNSVQLSGDIIKQEVLIPSQNLTSPCLANSYRFLIAKASEGVFSFKLIQKSPSNGLNSSSVNLSWVRDITSPGPIVLSNPQSTSPVSGGNSMALSGSCETDATVTLGGSDNQTIQCLGGSFTINVNKTSDGIYPLTLRQTDVAGNSSGELALSWTRDTFVPNSPTIVFPSSAVTRNNLSQLTITGSCANGMRLELSGDIAATEVINPSGSLSQICINGAYGFSFFKTIDGTYSFEISQRYLTNGNVSSPISATWIRDTQSPVPPVITSPSTFTYASSNSSLSIQGSCEIGATVNLSGDDVQSSACTPEGTFAFSINEQIGTYQYKLDQVDASNNASGIRSISWTRFDPSTPAPPTVTEPISSPFLSNGSSLTLSGSCQTGFKIVLSGDIAAQEISSPVGVPDPLSQICTGSTYRFELGKATDGTYEFILSQTNINSGYTSPPTLVTWMRDTGSPSSVTFYHPTANPYTSSESSFTLMGSCEIGALVALSGASSSSTQCSSSGSFDFTIAQATQGSFDFDIIQTDGSGNFSSPVSFRWVRDTSVPPQPVLTSPATSVLFSRTSSLQILGSCISGNSIELSGDITGSEVSVPSGSLATNCVNSSFTFVLSKTNEGTYNFNIAQRSQLNNLASSPVLLTWNLDFTNPFIPLINAPAGGAIANASDELSISGSCENQATVNLAGSDNQSVLCTENSFNFTVAKSIDDSYIFQIFQTDRAGNSSGTANVSWVRDTSVPSSPSITSPTMASVASKLSQFTLSGTCTNGMLVQIGNQVASSDIILPLGSLSQVCTNGVFSFTIGKSQDGYYQFDLKQLNPNNNFVSPIVSQIWIRDTLAPASPLVTTPSINPYSSSESNLVLRGECEQNATVFLSGSDTQQYPCQANGSFSFAISASSPNTYSYSLTQTDLAGNTSPSTSFSWIRNELVTNPPIVTSPSTSRFYSNQNSLTISGTCQDGHRVQLSGSVQGSDVITPMGNLLYQTCASSSFSFTITKSADSSYDILLSQTNVAINLTSSLVLLTWVKDTVPPSPVKLTSPILSPFVSSDPSLAIEGSCEPSAIVSVSGSISSSIPCDSASKSFRISVSRPVNNTQNYSFIQTDPASNTSTAVDLSWVFDSSLPPTPSITSHAGSTYSSNENSITISGSCVTNYIVNLSGNVSQSDLLQPPNALSQSCANASYSFTIGKSVDGNYSLSIDQTNTASGMTSAQAGFIWNRDTNAPAAPVLLFPSSVPYVSSGDLSISGSCESFANVKLVKLSASTGGELVGESACSSEGLFAMIIANFIDGIYEFSLTQADAAGNISSSTQFQWTRNSTVPSTPTIVSPANPMTYSSGNEFSLSGGCSSGMTVHLSGNVQQSEISEPPGSLSQPCNENGTFFFTLTKTVDGIHSLSIAQTNAQLISSPSVTRTWVRDTVPPTVTFTATPSASVPNLSLRTSFSFGTNEINATLQCKLGSGNFSLCTSPYSLTFSPDQNGLQTFTVRAIDIAGNISNQEVFQWTQNAFFTAALYHFDSSAETLDSSQYTGSDSNVLTKGCSPVSTCGLPTLATGKFLDGINLASSNSQFLNAPHSESQKVITETLTVEVFAKLTVNQAPNSYSTLVSKDSTSSGNFGWKFRLKRQGNGSNYRLIFQASLNGNSYSSELASSNCSIATNTWYHLAFTFDRGSVKFFCNGILSGSGTLGSVGTTKLFNTSGNLIIGKDVSNTTYYNGILDEIRISQVARWSKNFTPPTAAYSAD